MCQENCIANVRDETLSKINAIYPDFKNLSTDHKLCCILNLKSLNKDVDATKFSSLCISLVESVMISTR